MFIWIIIILLPHKNGTEKLSKSNPIKDLTTYIPDIILKITYTHFLIKRNLLIYLSTIIYLQGKIDKNRLNVFISWKYIINNKLWIFEFIDKFTFTYNIVKSIYIFGKVYLNNLFSSTYINIAFYLWII